MQDLGIFKSFKVLFLCNWYPNRNDPYNGLFIRNHAKIVAEYCKVFVIYAGADKNLISKTYELHDNVEDNIRTIRVYYKNSDLGGNYFSRLIKAYRYYNAIYKGLKIIQAQFGRPHIIHVNIVEKCGAAALILKKIKGIPYIVTEHWTGYHPRSGKFKGYFQKLIAGWVIKNAGTVTTVSDSLRIHMQSHQLYGNYEVVPNVVNTEINIQYKQSEKPIAINISDLVDEMKNISGIIKAAADIIHTVPGFELHIIGEGADKENLIKLATNLNLMNKHVFFFNYMPNEKVYEKISASSFLIVNSRYETFSVVAAEALACGVPVLTTRCGGPEEFINEENGMVIETDDQDQLVRGINWMIQNYQLFDAEKLRSYAKAKFSKEVIAAKFLSIYNKNVTTWKAGNSETWLRIDPEWRVLDVGSGNRPNERANVLLERELGETEHRSGAKAFIPDGKKLVLGDALNMPFLEKEFDYIIASHIAEHIENPDVFCRELSRVGKRGYIETPGMLCEFIFNEPFHKWLVYKSGRTLVFKEKTRFKVFSEFFYRLIYINERRSGHKPLYSSSKIIIKFVNLFRRFWKYIPMYYTRFYWEDNIRYKIIRKNE
jgi:glycosyltransferase involved in cell wall biosynthesis